VVRESLLLEVEPGVVEAPHAGKERRDELHEQDDWLTEFMRSDPFWEFERRVVTGDRLTLTSGDTVIELVARD
jgi:hypothetical protein